VCGLRIIVFPSVLVRRGADALCAGTDHGRGGAEDIARDPVLAAIVATAPGARDARSHASAPTGARDTELSHVMPAMPARADRRDPRGTGRAPKRGRGGRG